MHKYSASFVNIFAMANPLACQFGLSCCVISYELRVTSLSLNMRNYPELTITAALAFYHHSIEVVWLSSGEDTGPVIRGCRVQILMPTTKFIFANWPA